MVMHDNHANIFEFIVKLQAASTLDEAFAVYDKQVQNLGFEGPLYAFAPQLYLQAHLNLTPVFKVSPTRNATFLQHYQAEQFEQHDFTLKHILQGKRGPFDWWTEERKGYLTPDEKNVIQIARADYGMVNGISMCTMNEEVGVAGASMISSEHERLYEKLLAERLPTLVLCTEVFHAHVMSKPHLQHFFIKPLLDTLSPKEKKLLRFIVEGKPMKSSPLPDITYRYSDKLMHNIRVKFGGISKGRLIYYIGLMRLMNYL